MNDGEQEVLVRGKEISDHLIRTMLDSFNFYQQLAPDGRELSEAEREAVMQRLERSAVCLRAVHIDQDILDYVASDLAMDFRPVAEVLRMMQRSLVLALAEDEAHRQHAISPQRLVNYYKPIYDFLADLWDMPSWETLVARDRTP